METLKFKVESKKQKVISAALLIVGGGLIGLVNGFFGAGGGMLAVPLLTFCGKLPEKHSHATALLVILPLSIVTAIVYLLHGIWDGNIFEPTLIGVLIGGLIGASALKKLGTMSVTVAFYILMITVGLKMVM
ncbi:MAG: sulfite exporter TauE/SafE family protein [Clostridiales bacterium]|nr:sulfite exporter TauE/SafE family protein [Clostridiales bacterium]